MKVKDLVKQLMEYDEDSEVVIYEDDNDRMYDVICIDEDEDDALNEKSQEAITAQQSKQGVVLSSLNVGDIFTDSEGDKYIITKQSEGVTFVMCKEVLPDNLEFGNDNNFTTSPIRQFLNNDYLKTLESRFEAENIIEHETDLLSHDGLRDYGKITNKVSLRTYDDYREQREILDGNAFDEDRWEWLSTPDSTPSGYGSGCVQVVNSDGYVNCFGFSDFCFGVRPFFALKSSIFVSSCKE